MCKIWNETFDQIFLHIFSLNEYMNAGIEGVKITDENNSTSQYDAQTYTTPSKDSLCSVSNTNLIKHSNKSTANHLYATESTDSNGDNSIHIVENNEYIATEQRISNDLPSYEEQQVHENEIVHGSIKNSMENVINVEELSCESENSDTDEKNADDEKTTECEKGTEGTDKTTFNDSLDNELSSVVPPTSISLEISASHETETALPDTNNGESSEISDKITEDQMYVEDTATAAGEITKFNDSHNDINLNVNEQNNSHVIDNETIEKNNIEADDQHESNDRFIKPIPITFETAATMDDVSDTELESYLQELEDLEESSIGVKAKSDSIKSVNGSVQSDDIETCDSIYNINQTIENTSGARDDRNADSFSQASTVEFGEVNAPSSNEPNLNVEQNIETATGIDSVLDIESNNEIQNESQPIVEMSENLLEQIDDTQTETSTNVPIVCASEIGETNEHPGKELSSNLEHPNECSECEIDQQISNLAKRPNSLNLQNCNSTLVESPPNLASSSALNFSSEDNAGNTPPASGQFLSSSISSDDSNIATDNNQMIVSISQQTFFVYVSSFSTFHVQNLNSYTIFRSDSLSYSLHQIFHKIC